MNNKEKAYYIISKLDFNNLEVNTKPSAIIDNNKSVNLNWTVSEVSGGEIKESSGIKVLNFRTNNYKIFTTIPINTNIKNDSIQFEANIMIPNIKANNIFFNIGASSGTGFRFNIKNTFICGFEIFYNNKKITFNYKFENNVNYHILVTKEYNVYSFYINGLIIGNCVSDDFNNSITLSGTSLNLTIGAKSSAYSTTSDEFNGEISNVNISVSPYKDYLKYNKSFTKYGVNLVSRLNFGNIASTSSTTVFTPNLEAVTDSKMNWVYGNLTIKNDYATVDGTPFIADISNLNTIYFTVNNNNKIYNEIELLSLNNNYKIIYTSYFEGEPEPDVVVNENTTSALNFENGLTDKASTIWNKEGTGDVQSVNKLFGENSFETKALGDNLNTNNQIITGSSTPYTIEFYALIKGGLGYKDQYENTDPLYSKNNNGGGGDQLLGINNLVGGKLMLWRGGTVYGGNEIPKINGYTNIKKNEINKYTITYDGSAIRCFLNDKLDLTVGTLSGFVFSTANNFTFLDSLVTSFPTYRLNTIGIIDNINIHDGIATKVRDYDPYEEFLVVDLSFDGENNSTKIVDNGSGEAIWSVMGSAKLSTTNKFDGFSSLYLASNTDYIQTSKNNFNFTNDDFTLSFKIMKTTDQKWNVILSNASLDEININTLIAIGSSDSGDNRANKLYCIGIAVNGSRHTYISKAQILANKEYKIDIIVKNNTLYYYINDILDKSFTYNNDFDFTKVLSNYIYLGYCSWNSPDSFNGYIKNFKVYKGVAVIPKSPVGKIQLDFNNNFNDKYNNSTWANNGVTFDQVNSVKGSAAYFNGNSRLTTNLNDNLNFGKNNFKLSMDFNLTDFAGWNTFITSYASGVGGSTISYNNTSNITRVRLDINNYFDFPSYHVLNSYYNICQTRVGDSLLYKINDVVQSCFNTSLPLNHNSNSKTIISGLDYTYSESIKGYIDNFKSIKDYQGEVIIDIPAVHLPLETNAINTGFTPLTINSVGNPTYTTIDGKKCIKFESGKYLTINSNNIFNLGNSSDFYIEFDFYVIAFRNGAGGGTDSSIIRITGNWDNNSSAIQFNSNGNILLYGKNNKLYTTINNFGLNVFNKLIVKRQNSLVSIILNGAVETVNNFELDFSLNGTLLGSVDRSPYAYLNGYMSNFKMFVGTSQPPETYNDKKVLDLDFKPTGKSYLFKDNNNKCVIHPVNITQRDYQDSQYCCTFNGTNQYLQLGKNDLFNFGLDDFVINIKFKISNLSKMYNQIFSAGGNTIGRPYIAILGLSHEIYPNRLTLSVTGGQGVFVSNNSLEENIIYDIKFIRKDDTLSLYINDVLDSSITNWYAVPTNLIKNLSLNFNLNSETVIARVMSNENEYFNGTIYSIKVLRNTTDLSLLEEEKVIYSSDEKFVLTNGEEAEEIAFTEIKERDIKVINDNDKITFKIDDNEVELAKTTEVDNIKLFDGYTSQVKDVRVYDIAMYDDDEFLGSELIDTQYPELEFYDDSDIQELQVIDVGEYVIKGFIEGGVDRKYIIRNKVENFDLLKGSGDYYYDGIDERYIDDYEIYEIESKQRYPLYKHEMKKGYISGTVNLANCGLKKGQKLKVYCYRNDNSRLIGIYELDENNRYEIPNLDVNSKYDIIFKDDSRKIENISSSYRTPKEY